MMLTSIFGRWPSFQDAEVVDLAIWRGDVDPDRKKYTLPVLTVKIFVNDLVPEPTNESRLQIVPQAHVTFRFYDVDDLKLEGFNHVNQIVGLSFAIQPRGSFTDDSELQPYIVVEFERGFGMAASLKCFRVEAVDVAPYPADPCYTASNCSFAPTGPCTRRPIRITDAYLRGLAQHYKGKLATFDGGIAQFLPADARGRCLELIEPG